MFVSVVFCVPGNICIFDVHFALGVYKQYHDYPARLSSYQLPQIYHQRSDRYDCGRQRAHYYAIIGSRNDRQSTEGGVSNDSN